MDKEYRIALAYSNTQKDNNTPTIISGIIAYEDDYEELMKRELPRKKTLVKLVDSLSGLQAAFDDLSQYLTDHIAIQLKKSATQENVEAEYIKALNILRKSHFYAITGKVKTINIRKFSKYDAASKTWQNLDFTKDFEAKLMEFSPDYQAHGDEFEPFLEVSKILARLEYERLRMLGKDYVISKVLSDPSNYTQIIKIKWETAPIYEYSNEKVGPPAIIVRGTSKSSSINYRYLDIGMGFDFSPLVKFCKGSQNEQEVLPCEFSSKNNPFGLPLIGSFSEQCYKCHKRSEYATCLYRKPLCNGYEVKCQNSKFAGHVCCGLFGLYVTRFGEDLKVGTAILSNIVSRLLEQGVGSALVVYPIEGIMTAHVLEKIVRDHLASYLSELSKYGIKHVYRKAPPSEEKIQDFLMNWSRIDEDLLTYAGSLVSEIKASIDGFSIDLLNSERKICIFLDNYIRPQETEFAIEPSVSVNQAKGHLVGYRGNYVFLDSGKILDIKEHHGYVVRGKL